VKITRLALPSILCTLASLLACADGYAFDDGPGVLRDPTVIACFAHLVRSALGGFATFEKAAFLALRADHSVQCIDWPSTREFKQAQWSGPMPSGVVAVAHTHPLSSPFASPDDVKLARRIRMPIFVLTPNMVSVVHADGRVEMLVYGKEWISALRKSPSPQASAVPSHVVKDLRDVPGAKEKSKGEAK